MQGHKATSLSGFSGLGSIGYIEDIDSNVNIELLLDKFVIELGDYVE